MTDGPLVKGFISQHYDSSEGRDDKYKLFMERAHLLARHSLKVGWRAEQELLVAPRV